MYDELIILEVPTLEDFEDHIKLSLDLKLEWISLYEKLQKPTLTPTPNIRLQSPYGTIFITANNDYYRVVCINEKASNIPQFIANIKVGSKFKHLTEPSKAPWISHGAINEALSLAQKAILAYGLSEPTDWVLTSLSTTRLLNRVGLTWVDSHPRTGCLGPVRGHFRKKH